MKKEEYFIFIDNGGTFTDCVIIGADGSYATGKSDTTPDNLEECFFSSIEAAAENYGVSLGEVISASKLIGYGTTLGTNIIVSRTAGARLGFITTKGIEDRTLIMRLRASGLSPFEGMHLVAADKPEPIIPRPRIKGITERIDCKGQVVIPIIEDEVRQAADELLADGVEGICIGFVWSFLNNVHEKRARAIIEEMSPDVPVSISSDVAPIMREYPRFMSTIIDLYIGKSLKELLGKIKNGLQGEGYQNPFLIQQAYGGFSRSEIVSPGTTLHSGPVGGLAGVEFLKQAYGFKNAMGSDVGGTSFDVTISPERGSSYLREPIVGRFEIATPMREIITIGAGGGTVARVDDITRTLIVGPDSAGSMPGPVCYDLDGVQPTVTDADLVMNRLNDHYFLGGKKVLNRDKACSSIKEKIADSLKMSPEQAAEAICAIVDGSMKTTLKSVMSKKGVNARDSVLFSFGGAGPSHCAGYSSGLGFQKVIITPYSSVFSAFGEATSDIVHRYEASPLLSIECIPYDVSTSRFEMMKMSSEDFEQVLPSEQRITLNDMFQDLRQRAVKDMEEEGFEIDNVTLRHEVFARYVGQLWEINYETQIYRIQTIDDLRTIILSFEEEYLKEYGTEAMMPAGGVEIVSIAVESISRTTKPNLIRHGHVGEDCSAAFKKKRDVWFDGEWIETDIYDLARLQVGNIVKGPSIIEGADMTVVVPSTHQVFVDEYLNLVMTEN